MDWVFKALFRERHKIHTPVYLVSKLEVARKSRLSSCAEFSSLAIVVAANVLLDYKALPHVSDEMTSPDTANTPTEHDTLKLNGNGNHNETTASLTTDGLTELKGKIERGGEDVVKEEEEGEEEEEEESEEEEEEEDDEEPSLKYERITGDVPDLLKKDPASALAVSNKLLVISLIIIFVIICNL